MPFVEILDLSNLADQESSRTFAEGRETPLLLTKGISDDALGHGIRRISAWAINTQSRLYYSSMVVNPPRADVSECRRLVPFGKN